MILRSGAKVHAAIQAETGGPIGSPCRFRGTLLAIDGTGKRERLYVLLENGSVAHFTRAETHHVDDCPRRA